MDYIIGNTTVLDDFTVVTLGNFDGIHLGHRKLISTVKEYAKNEKLVSVVCSFLPHPKFLFNQEEDFSLILSQEEKKKRIEKMGVDIYIDFSFSHEFANLPPEEFATKYIFENLKCRVVVVGEDYRFGEKRAGTPELLRLIGKKYNAKVITIPEVMIENKKVSSSRIRQLIKNGEIDKANSLLVEPYCVVGNVIECKKLGRTIGFPTANIISDSIKLYPPNGVYVTNTIYNNKKYNSITNIGYNPTVSGKVKMIETHILDFDENIYGENLEVQFLDFFRAENKFENIDKLKSQIDIDTKKAIQYFKNI